jgi:hypothetical protein
MPSLSLDSEHESIFSEQAGDDLFDEPTPVLAPTPTPVYEPEPVHEPVMTPTPIEALPLTPEPATYPAPIPVQADTPSTGWDVSQPATTITSEAPVAESELPSVGREARKKKGPQLNWPLLLMIPLVSYSILATALILYLWNRIEAVRTSVANPLEFMPDIHGDAPGATKKNVRRGWKPDENQALAALPSDHKARLGEKIVVGNLEVEPVRVERGKINIKVAGYNPEPTIADTLILRMRFRNLSEDFTFAPLDNAFDRKWKGIKMEGVPPLDYKPFTVLQVGSTNYFGGTAKWIPRNPPAALRRTHREWMLGEGRGETPVPLDPGQVLESFVATDGDDEKLVPTALAHNGDLVWRVHVRQGPVEVKGRNEPIPSTTVIAVTFKPSEVKPKEES